MSLIDKIKVNTHYTRSINLERDADSQAVVEAYIPTSRALRTLERIAEALKADESPRAWSLVGPYGSGKSSFAVFLAHLLGSSSDTATQAAKNTLKHNNQLELRNKFTSVTRGSEGYCTVLMTGSPESIGRRLVRSLADKANEIWAGRRGRSHSIVAKLARLAEQKEPPATTDILTCVEEMQDALSGIGYSGLLIVIDELGKFLEYEARHYGVNDIFLLQSLAEHALAPHDARLAMVVMLHQAFEQYARGLGETLKNEWAKVQGRFENIPFLESAEQTLRIVAAAIEHNLARSESSKIKKESKQLARDFSEAKALPSAMGVKVASELFEACYPLHPISALILPLLCQKVAQNERTLFSYLGSREAHGFQESLSRHQTVGDWVYPWEIYEYFILNQPAALSDHFTHRRWAEVVTAIERLGDATEDEVNVLKTIGLLNIIGAQGNFKASKELTELSLLTKGAVEKALKGLTQKSVIQYRKFSSEYRVWQGSDFDLEEYVREEIGKFGAFNLAEQLNARHTLLPIVARRYTIDSGALRYFVPVFSDALNYERLDVKSRDARIIFYLAESSDDAILFTEKVINRFSGLDIVVLCQNGDQLREILAETLALEEIQRSAQALHSDPVAMREFRDRYAAALAKEEEQISYLIEEPALGQWFYLETQLEISSKRALQEALSLVLEKVYHQSPKISNELINRDKPSSQANAAKNKLVLAMLRNEKEEDLGFDKFPPEKAIYRAMLRKANLHVEGENGKWYFKGPASSRKADDPCNFYGVWTRIDRFLDTTEKSAKSLIELNRELIAPPYGVKEGVLPILYVAVIIANQDELAIYENRVFKPRFTEEMIEHFMKRPDEFAFQRFRIAGLNSSIFKEYSKALFRDGKTRDLLGIAKPIANFIFDLPEYTQKTVRGLSRRSQSVRDVFKLSKSPVTLLVEDVPKALGYELEGKDHNESSVAGLSNALTEILRELKHCFPELKDEMRSLCAQAFHLDKGGSIQELRKSVYGRYKGLEDYTIDRDGQRAFILRLTQESRDDDEWFDGLLTFLGHKPVEKWSDPERDAAEYRLIEFSRKLDDLEKLRIHYQSFDNKINSDFDVYLIRSVKKGAPDYDEVVAIDSARHETIKIVKEEISKKLDELGENELGLAALAEVVDEFLTKYRESDKKVSNIKLKGKHKSPKEAV
ncbi:MAG: hypothetical protein ACE5EH_06715 [Gammaproteobacteria bacterium]